MEGFRHGTAGALGWMICKKNVEIRSTKRSIRCPHTPALCMSEVWYGNFTPARKHQATVLGFSIMSRGVHVDTS